jgi:hypothetical protein
MLAVCLTLERVVISHCLLAYMGLHGKLILLLGAKSVALMFNWQCCKQHPYCLANAWSIKGFISNLTVGSIYCSFRVLCYVQWIFFPAQLFNYVLVSGCSPIVVGLLSNKGHYGHYPYRHRCNELMFTSDQYLGFHSIFLQQCKVSRTVIIVC